MNKTIGSLWVQALKSGDYILIPSSLKKSSRKFCALGVLADVMIKEKFVDTKWVKKKGEWLVFGESFYLPTEFTDEAGIRMVCCDSDDCLCPEPLIEEVVRLNDSGAPIKVVASFIENNMEKL